jgi:hypothetical protein
MDFSYQAGIGFYIFIIPGMVPLIKSFSNAGHLPLCAVLKNPVDAIRYE